MAWPATPPRPGRGACLRGQGQAALQSADRPCLFARDAERSRVFGPMSLKLAEAFWPGPLTLVLPLATARDPSSRHCGPGARSRAHAVPLAHDLIVALGRPIAAPSANRPAKLARRRPRQSKPTGRAHSDDPRRRAVPLVSNRRSSRPAIRAAAAAGRRRRRGHRADLGQPLW